MVQKKPLNFNTLDAIPEDFRLQLIKQYNLTGTKAKPAYIHYLEGKELTRSQSIQAKCWECMGGTTSIDCLLTHCPLYPYSPCRNKKGK